jgi:hypothetical protein
MQEIPLTQVKIKDPYPDSGDTAGFLLILMLINGWKLLSVATRNTPMMLYAS